MKKTITRHHADLMFRVIGRLPLGNLDTELIEATMDNMTAFGAVSEEITKMTTELSKRLFDGIEQEKLKEYDEMAQKEGVTDDALKSAFPELYPLAVKQGKVVASIRNKEVEMEIKEMDKDAFIKGVLAGKAKLSIRDFDIFEPMFKTVEKKKEEEDFSELDELMKDSTL